MQPPKSGSLVSQTLSRDDNSAETWFLSELNMLDSQTDSAAKFQVQPLTIPRRDNNQNIVTEGSKDILFSCF